MYKQKNQLQHNLPTSAKQKTRGGGQTDPNRGHPNNQESEATFTLLLQRTCKVGAVNTSTPAGRGNPLTKEPPTDNDERRRKREWKPH